MTWSWQISRVQLLVKKTREVDSFVSDGKNNQLSINLDKQFTQSLANFVPLRCHKKKKSKLAKIKNSQVINEVFNVDQNMSKKEKFHYRKSLVNGLNN